MTKKSSFLFVSVLFLCGCDLLQSVEKLKSDANSALSARNFSTAAELAEKWSKKDPERYEAYFVLAQARAQAGDKNGALGALEQALKKGLKDDVEIEANRNLEPIRSMVAYADLMKSSFPSRNQKSSDPEESSPVSITEKDGKQTVRAGDVVIQVPSLK